MAGFTGRRLTGGLPLPPGCFLSPFTINEPLVVTLFRIPNGHTYNIQFTNSTLPIFGDDRNIPSFASREIVVAEGREAHWAPESRECLEPEGLGCVLVKWRRTELDCCGSGAKGRVRDFSRLSPRPITWAHHELPLWPDSAGLSETCAPSILPFTISHIGTVSSHVIPSRDCQSPTTGEGFGSEGHKRWR